MRVLSLTNLFPTAQSPSKAVFISSRIQVMREFGVDVDVWAVGPDRAGITTALSRLLKQAPSSEPNAEMGFSDARLRLGPARHALLRYRGTPRTIIRDAADQISDKVDISSFDVIQAHGMYGIGAGFVAEELGQRFDIPFVIQLHGGDINYSMDRNRNAYARTLASASSAVFVSNTLVASAKAKGYSSSNFKVIPNGVDTDLFSPVHRSDSRRELNLDTSEVAVAFVGNLVPVKGADRLPDIFREVALRIPNSRFLVVGDGQQRERLEIEMSGLPVSFLGQVPAEQVARVLAAADVLVLPSRNEGWPCVIYEAYATETPVVGTKVGGVEEALSSRRFAVADGRNLPRGFADAIVTVLREQSLHELRTLAKQNTWHNVVSREIAVLAHACGQVGGGLRN